jgi:hypothetical protein
MAIHGFSGEVALHIQMGTIIGTEWQAVPFYRYTTSRPEASWAPMPTRRRDKGKKTARKRID